MDYNLPFEPSEYQRKIFDFVLHGTGNAVVNAKAGSAKTTTMVAAMSMVNPKLQCMFIAFNKSIAEELSKRTEDKPNCHVTTVHALGLKMIERNLSNPQLDEFKYRSYAIKKLASIENSDESFASNVFRLIDLSRLNLCQTAKEVRKTADEYGVSILGDECDVVMECLKWGKENTSTIDYTDMVWLPYELSLVPKGLQYDWIFLDEGQDFSKAYIQIFLKCFKRGTRFIAVLDERQLINGFAGASKTSVKQLFKQPHTVRFELPISYRCDAKIIREAQKIVSDIQCRDNVPDGDVVYNGTLDMVKDGDLVLCRYNAPLVKIYAELSKRGLRCRINGGLDTDRLLFMLRMSKSDNLSIDLDNDGVFRDLYVHMFDIADKVSQSYSIPFEDALVTEQVMIIYDNIKMLEFFADGWTTKEELIGRIMSLCDNNSDGVLLSTVHRAKGLEADNVFIAGRSYMPSFMAKTEWELQQEENLIYVAVTRAKHKLVYLSDETTPSMVTIGKKDSFLEEVKRIKNKIGWNS